MPAVMMKVGCAGRVIVNGTEQRRCYPLSAAVNACFQSEWGGVDLHHEGPGAVDALTRRQRCQRFGDA